MTQKVENLIENSGVIFKKMANKNKKSIEKNQ